MAGPAIPALIHPLAHLVSSIEFLNVGGWLSGGDLALESKAHFLAVAEHRLTPAGARSATAQLRHAGRSLVWAPSCQDVTPGRHAGVGVISLHGASPVAFHDSYSFPEGVFWTGARDESCSTLGQWEASRTSLSLYRYQGAENDPEKLELSEHLLAAVLAEAKMCCSGQPVMLAGDPNADPSVTPSLATSMGDGAWIDAEKAFAMGRGVSPTVEMARVYSPFWPACWVHCSDRRSRRSSSDKVRNIWDVCIQELSFVLKEVRERLRTACNTDDVDASWQIWSKEAEASLVRLPHCWGSCSCWTK